MGSHINIKKNIKYNQHHSWGRKKSLGEGTLASEMQPLSKYNRASFPAALEQIAVSAAEHQRKHLAWLVF